MTEDEGESPSINRKVPPAPRQLTMEAQHNKAVVIGWTGPDETGSGPTPAASSSSDTGLGTPRQIVSYELVVDGMVHSTVPCHGAQKRGFDDTIKTTVNGLDLSVIHRISVKSVTRYGHCLAQDFHLFKSIYSPDKVRWCLLHRLDREHQIGEKKRTFAPQRPYLVCL